MSTTFRTGGIEEFLAFCQRALAVWSKFHVIRKCHRKILFFHHHFTAVIAVDDGNRRTPVSLPGDQPVSQSVVDLQGPAVSLLQPQSDLLFGFFAHEAIKFSGVHHSTDFGVGKALAPFNDSLDGQVIFLCEFEVSFIMGWNSHDDTGTVGVQDIITDPDGDVSSVDGVHCIGTCEDAGLFSGQRLTIDVALHSGLFYVGFHFRSLLIGGKLGNHGILRSKDHIGCTVKGIHSCGEDFEFQVLLIHLEFHGGAVGSSNPVSLHGFGLLRPVQTLQIFQKLIGILGDAEEPLGQVFLDDGRLASFAGTVENLLVGQDRVTARAPVYRSIFSVSQTILVELHKQPLGPFVVVWCAGHHFMVPVEHGTHGFQLHFHGLDVF